MYLTYANFSFKPTVTIIGYGHYKKAGKPKNYLYWIVQNSWGITRGQNGYVFIAAGSMGQAAEAAHGVKVDEGSSRDL